MNKPTNLKAAAYAWMIPHITSVARECGYAIGLHGSMNRDLDLIAVPWVDDAISADDLIEKIRESVDGYIVPDGTRGGKFDPISNSFVDAIVHNPSYKPHGRLAWNIHVSDGFCIDISVMPIIWSTAVGVEQI